MFYCLDYGAACLIAALGLGIPGSRLPGGKIGSVPGGKDLSIESRSGSSGPAFSCQTGAQITLV